MRAWMVSPVPLAGAGGLAVGLAAALVGGYPAVATMTIAAFLAVLAVVSAIDVRERRIPNVCTYPAIGVALTAAAISGPDTLMSAGLGFAAAGGSMAIMYLIARGGLGLGDVKLCALAGAVLGLSGVFPFLLIGTAAGALGAGVLLVRGFHRTSHFAYGPYLSLGAACVALLRGPVLG